MLKFIYLIHFIFFNSLLGLILLKRHLLSIFIFVELMTLAVNLNFFVFSIYLDDLIGQFFVIFILIVIAAETAVGLSILLVYFRLKGNIFLVFINLLKG